MPTPSPPTRENVLGALASRDAAFMADKDISERHHAEKHQARLRIAAKLAQHWASYKTLPALQKVGYVANGKLTTDGARHVRSLVVKLLRAAPLTHGFDPKVWFGTTSDVGDRMKNCWHLNLGSGRREKTETSLFRYDHARATPQMTTHAHGGKASASFEAATRPFYAALNYARARHGGSSGWGKTHLVLKDHLRFNATFTCVDSFGIEAKHADKSWQHLANYHNPYPILIGVSDGAPDSTNVPTCDVLKSMIDHATGLSQPPAEEFDGRQYVEAQIPGDILFARDVLRVVVDRVTVPPDSTHGKRCKAFARQHGLLIDFI